MSDKKAFESLGLTRDEIIEMQEWLYPVIVKSDKMSEMISKVVEKYPEGTMRHYALYHLGNKIGAAKIKEQLGLPCVLNPAEI